MKKKIYKLFHFNINKMHSLEETSVYFYKIFLVTVII